MKRTTGLLLTLVICASLLLTGCYTRKNAVLLQDQPGSSKSFFKGTRYDPAKVNVQADTSDKSKQMDLIKIQPFDVLDIKVTPSLVALQALTESKNVITATGAGGYGGYYTSFLVTEEGKVTLPIIGEITVANLTIGETKAIINDKLKGILADPYIEVKFLTFKVSVLGGVGSPGQITISNEKGTLIDALSLVGGVSDFGDPRKIKVIRGDMSNPTIYILDLTTVKALKAKGFALMPNDIIYVEPNSRRFLTTNLASVVGFVSLINIISLLLTLSLSLRK